MTVYVDDAQRPLGRMKMCHMSADTEAELHAMADRLNIPRKHYHAGHYNICKLMRKRAVGLGALPITQRQMVGIRRALDFDRDTIARTRRVSLLRLFDPDPAPAPSLIGPPCEGPFYKGEEGHG